MRAGSSRGLLVSVIVLLVAVTPAVSGSRVVAGDGADAVVLNVMVNDPENFGFVTAYPCGVDRPNASNLNYAPGQTIPNPVIVKVGGNGRVCLFSDQTTHLFADVSGYFV